MVSSSLSFLSSFRTYFHYQRVFFYFLISLFLSFASSSALSPVFFLFLFLSYFACPCIILFDFILHGIPLLRLRLSSPSIYPLFFYFLPSSFRLSPLPSLSSSSPPRFLILLFLLLHLLFPLLFSLFLLSFSLAFLSPSLSCSYPLVHLPITRATWKYCSCVASDSWIAGFCGDGFATQIAMEFCLSVTVFVTCFCLFLIA